MKEPVTWNRFPREEAYFQSQIDEMLTQNSFLARTANRLSAYAATRLLDIADAICLPGNTQIPTDLAFSQHSETDNYAIYQVPGSCLPRLLIGDYGGHSHGILLKVEQIAYFQAAHQCPAKIVGLPFGEFRRSLINVDNEVAVFVCEKRIADQFEPYEGDVNRFADYHLAWEEWLTRPRRTMDFTSYHEMSQLMEETCKRARKIVTLVGTKLAGDVVMNAERVYWQARNDVGKSLKQILDYVGIGWVNHDHHTFRCSRANFTETIRILELLGFTQRETYYAGEKSGWGAQLMNHPSGLTLFVDVDLTPDELADDLTRISQEPLTRPGTVDMWCRLHGESLFDAGLHHIANRHDILGIQRKMQETNQEKVLPLSDFPHLRQAYSVGQRWPVVPGRLQSLIKDGYLSDEKANVFTRVGAIGSHLEVIERNEGFKGFSPHRYDNLEAMIDLRQSP